MRAVKTGRRNEKAAAEIERFEGFLSVQPMLGELLKEKEEKDK